MKKLFIYLLLSLPLPLMAQIGIKGGLNFAKVSKASEISSSNKAGFHAGIFPGYAFQKNDQLPYRTHFFTPGIRL